MNVSGEVNIQQIEACLKDWSTFGVTHIKNICTGTTTDVPWGVEGWLAFIFASGFIAVLVILVLVGLTVLIHEATS